MKIVNCSFFSKFTSFESSRKAFAGTWQSLNIHVPEIIDPVFTKTSPKRSFSMTEYERFGLVFTKTRPGSKNSGTGLINTTTCGYQLIYNDYC